MAPPYVDEDPGLALVQDGLDVAEDEIRDAVADDYEASALESDDAEDELNDIEFTSGDSLDAPELAAMHEETIPEEEGEDG